MDISKSKVMLSSLNKYFPILIFLATFLMGVGYASINAILLNVDGELLAKSFDGVFITEVEYMEREDVLPNEQAKINLAGGTMLNSTVKLEPNNDSSIVSLKVSFYNDSEFDYIFKNVIYEESLLETMPEIYSNFDIEYSFDNQNEIITKNGGTLDVIISFKYLDGVEESSNILNSILNFDFQIRNSFIITFDGNGGTVDNPTKEVLHNYPYGELPVPIREGYTFSGWSIEKEGNEFITEDTIVNIDEAHTLYAQWNTKKYTIRYHANGGTGTMVDQVMEYDAMVTLSPNLFTKTGFKFYGWALIDDGEKVYNDMESVVNLSLDGIVDLYALWVEDSYTVTFDYNGGTGSVDSIQVLYGTNYGSLPDYPYKQEMVFAGWYTAKTGGTKVFSDSIVTIKGNHTLYAQWESSPYNTAIQDMITKNVPDNNNDGVIDAIYLNFKCSSSFEKYNIPIKNLIVGQKYRLSFIVSNNAQFGTIESGYKNSIFGSMLTTNANLSSGSIKTEVIADGGLVADWEDRTKGDEWLHGPFEMEMEFSAEATTMYWTWDFGLMMDGILYDYNITNIVLEPVEPDIDFSNKKLVLYTSSTAKILSDVSSTYASNFTFLGASYAETLYYPITNLTSGATYSITFEHLYNGKLIDDSASTSTLRYEYGTGIMSGAPTKYGSYMTSIGSYISNTYVMKTVTGNKEVITLTFTATGDTAYWVWNMANCSDGYNNIINLKVTNLSVTHKNGKKIIFYSS